jgi:hypothetical protein
MDWVAESGKNLIAIYIAHARGDHFFGLKLLLDRFPTATAFARAWVVAAIQSQIKPEFIKSVWEPRFPGQLPSQLAASGVLQGDTLYLEGEDPDSSPRHIEETRGYIRDFSSTVAETSTAQDLYEKMLTLHPNRVNPGSLEAAANVAKPGV